MFKTVAIILSVLFAASVAASIETIDSNLVEYDAPAHLRRANRPLFSNTNTKVKNIAVHPVNYYNHGLESEVVPMKPVKFQLSKPGIISWIYDIVKSVIQGVIKFFVEKIQAITVTILDLFGICKFIPILCSNNRRMESATQEELGSVASTEKLAKAAYLLQEAVRRYKN